jgi:hypothetical protein
MRFDENRWPTAVEKYVKAFGAVICLSANVQNGY